MPRRRRHVKRSRRRMERHLRQRCKICAARQQYNPVPLPCCNGAAYIHESCLLRVFQSSVHANDYRCPYCRQLLIPYNADEPFRPEPGHEGYPFPFYHHTFISLRGDHQPWNDDDIAFYFLDENNETPENNNDLGDIPSPPVTLTPPSGWTEFMRQMRRS